MKKFEQFIFEELDIRKLMTPRSDAELKTAFYNLSISKNKLSDFENNTDEFNKISTLFKTKLEDLYLISQDNEKYDSVDNYFKSLVEGIEPIEIKVKTKNNYEISWLCYPEKKLAYWDSNKVVENSGAWIYRRDDYIDTTKDILKKWKEKQKMKTFEQFINEELNVRELMRPKSEEEIEKSLNKLSPNEKFLKACKYNWVWLAKKALDEGADFNKSESLLKGVVRNNHFEILEFLLDNGVNPDAILVSGPSHKIEPDIKEFLLKNGIESNIIELLLKYSKQYNK